MGKTATFENVLNEEIERRRSQGAEIRLDQAESGKCGLAVND